MASQTQLPSWNGHSACLSLRLEVSGVGATVNPQSLQGRCIDRLTPAGYNDSAAERIVSRGKAGVRAYASARRTRPNGHRRRKRARRSGNDYHAIRPHERRHWRCIDKLHRNGKRGCFWKRGNHASDYGNRDVLPVFSDDCKRHNFDNLHLYAGRVRVGEHQYHERRRPCVAGSPITYTSSAADTTAPTLSSATGTKTGQTTGTGGVTTNEANGTLYAFVLTVRRLRVQQTSRPGPAQPIQRPSR